MSKLLNYLGILATILTGAHLLGLIQNTGTSVILSWLSNPESLLGTSIFSSLINVLSLVGVAGAAVAAGLFITQKQDLGIFVGLASLLFLVGWDILGIYTALKDINSDFALLLVSPLMLIYFMTVIEFWRGTG